MSEWGGGGGFECLNLLIVFALRSSLCVNTVVLVFLLNNCELLPHIIIKVEAAHIEA